MSKNIILLFKKIRQHGLSWFFSRLLEEAERPVSRTRKILRPIITVFYWLFLYPINKFRSYRIKPESIFNNKLYLFYDLEVSPITCDFAWALVVANHHRKKMGLRDLHVVFVPGRYHGVREEDPAYEAKIDLLDRIWRKDAILHALTNLLPACTGVTFCSSREEASVLCEQVRPHIFPKQYSVSFPVAHSNHPALTNEYPLMSLKSTEPSRRYIQQWLDGVGEGRKLIVITLRQSGYMPERNSDIKAWANFAKSLNPREYFVVFVPDTEKAFEPVVKELQSFYLFTEVCWNLELRSALYESAYLNLGVNNGVMALCWLNPSCRYITFKMMVDTVSQASKASLELHGFKLGKSLPFANLFQKWVWKNDGEEIIQTEFEAMCALLQAKESKGDRVEARVGVSAVN